MRSNKEHGSNGAPGAAEAPWLRDPPKGHATTEGSSELEAELDKLAKGIAEEVKSQEKAPAKIIVAGGLDEAKAYIAPTRPAAHPEHATLEMQRVRIATDADPRRAVTEKVDRAVVLRAAGLEGTAASSWSTEAKAGINKALLPSSHAPGTAATKTETASAPGWSRKLAITVLLAMGVLVILAVSVRLLRSKESVTSSAVPAASLGVDPQSPMSTGVQPVAAVAPAESTSESSSAPSDSAAPALSAAGSSVSPATTAPPGVASTVVLPSTADPAAAIMTGALQISTGVPRPSIVFQPSGTGAVRAPSQGSKAPVKPGVKSSAQPELFD